MEPSDAKSFVAELKAIDHEIAAAVADHGYREWLRGLKERLMAAASA